MGFTFSNQRCLSRRHTAERAKTSENEGSWEKMFVATSGGIVDKEGWRISSFWTCCDDMAAFDLLMRGVTQSVTWLVGRIQ